MSLGTYATYRVHEKNLMLDWGTVRMDKILLEHGSKLSPLQVRVLEVWRDYYVELSELAQKNHAARNSPEMEKALNKETEVDRLLSKALRKRAGELKDAHAKHHLTALADTLDVESKSNDQIVEKIG